MAKRDISVLQLHQGYNIKPIDVADLAEQVIKALPPEKRAVRKEPSILICPKKILGV
jgi:hypothetical protein